MGTSYPHCLHEIVLPVVTLAPVFVSKPVATTVEEVLEIPLVVTQVTPAAGTQDVAPEAAEVAPETTDVAALAAVVVVGAGWKPGAPVVVVIHAAVPHLLVPVPVCDPP